jgi:hypothetical protein
MALGPLNYDLTSLPQVSIQDYVPDVILQPKREPLTPNQPRAVSSLQNKYAPGGLFDQLTQSGQYASHALEAMRAYDEDRAQRGQAPLTESQTLNALKAATDREQVTPEAKRGMLNLPKNLVGDMGDILRSIPQLPGALLHEVQSAVTSASPWPRPRTPSPVSPTPPSIRMLPRCIHRWDIAGGTPGELARHPLFTLLDVLPLPLPVPSRRLHSVGWPSWPMLHGPRRASHPWSYGGTTTGAPTTDHRTHSYTGQ